MDKVFQKGPDEKASRPTLLRMLHFETPCQDRPPTILLLNQQGCSRSERNYLPPRPGPAKHALFSRHLRWIICNLELEWAAAHGTLKQFLTLEPEEDPELQAREIRQMVARQLDAFVIASCGNESAAFEKIDREGQPYVLWLEGLPA
jgi:hypothetical protein